MDCVNHSGTAAAAYCQNCGKPLCAQCVRQGVAHGGASQILCEQCFAAYSRVAQPFGAPVSSAPNPVLAGILGIIPGVGAMYNGQFFKGLIHVVIFAVLISLTDHYDIFGIFIAAWVLYQAFEAYHTARARRDGTPVPDPLGLNEVASWLNLSWQSRNPAEEWERQQRAKAAAGQNPGPAGPMPGANPYPNPDPNPGGNPGYTAGAYQNPPAGAYQSGYQQVPYTPVPGYEPGAVPPGGIPPVPPVPPPYWRRREPIGAVILIGLGLIFLLNQMGYVTERIVHYSWPLVLIALGVWLIVRRMGSMKGGQQ
jgi:TM2 domain-containing membrane protein YozV